MARLFAIADLHLSGTGDKPMDRFGALWVGHADRMGENWDRVVEAEDWVLLPGDLSWARNLDEAACDLAWIEAPAPIRARFEERVRGQPLAGILAILVGLLIAFETWLLVVMRK